MRISGTEFALKLGKIACGKKKLNTLILFQCGYVEFRYSQYTASSILYSTNTKVKVLKVRFTQLA